jgi:hypothetical protein
MGTDINLNQELTANQLYKIYKDEGGTLTFKNWLTREKTKGEFPLDANVNGEINNTLTNLTTKNMDSTTLGFPTKNLLIIGGVIVAAIVVMKYMKKK